MYKYFLGVVTEVRELSIIVSLIWESDGFKCVMGLGVSMMCDIKDFQHIKVDDIIYGNIEGRYGNIVGTMNNLPRPQQFIDHIRQEFIELPLLMQYKEIL
jgi:hypothetical protein